MNIKRIIQEEMNSFDWADDVPSATELVTPQNVKLGLRVKLTEDETQYTDGEVMNIFLRQSGGGYGNTTHIYEGNDWVDVQWDNGNRNPYPIGHKGTYSLTMINDSIQESNEFEWTDELGGIHIGMCFSRTNTSAKYKVISMSDGGLVTSTGVAQARRIVHWDEVELLGYLSDGTLTICQDPKVT